MQITAIGLAALLCSGTFFLSKSYEARGEEEAKESSCQTLSAQQLVSADYYWASERQTKKVIFNVKCKVRKGNSSRQGWLTYFESACSSNEVGALWVANKQCEAKYRSGEKLKVCACYSATPTGNFCG